MKLKRIFLYTGLLLLSLSLIACSPSPEVTLNGEANITLEAGNSFNDPGVTVENSDEDFIVTGVVNEDKVGAYTLTYYVLSEDGKKSNEVSRYVEVEDTTAPTFNLELEVMIFGSTFNIENIVSSLADNNDSNNELEITSNYSSAVNTNISGEYTVTVTVTDTNDNYASKDINIVYIADEYNPFDILKYSTSYFIEYIITRDDLSVELNVEGYYEIDDKGDEIIYDIIAEYNFKTYKTKDFVYKYDAPTDIWYRSASDYDDFNSIEIYDINNYSYDESTKEFKFKTNIDAGNLLNNVIYIDETGNIHEIGTYAAGEYIVTLESEYSRFNEEFNLELPTDFIIVD